MKLKELKCPTWCVDCKSFDWGCCKQKYRRIEPSEYAKDMLEEFSTYVPDIIIDTNEYIKQLANDIINVTLVELDYLLFNTSEINVNTTSLIKARINFYKQVKEIINNQ